MLPSRKSQRRQDSDALKRKKGEEWISNGIRLTSKKQTDAMPN